jgi:diacylglycerol kinase
VCRPWARVCLVEGRKECQKPMSLVRYPPGDLDLAEPPPRLRPRKTLGSKFRVAFRGMKLGIRGHSSFFVHFFFSALVVVAALVLRCELMEWCVLLGCIALVITAELFNSALETLFKGLDDSTKERVWPSLDVAAGAVLFASLAAAVIGSIIFLQRLLNLFR